MTFNFTGTGADWKTFFQRATVNWTIKTLLVDQKEKTLFTSVVTEGLRTTWATVRGVNFALVGKGSFVVSVPLLKDAITMMKPDREYVGTIDGNKLKVWHNKQKMTVKLSSQDKYEKDPKSTYVKFNEGANERYQISIVPNKDKIPTLRRPPVDGKPGPPWEQLVGIAASDLALKLKHAKVIGSGSFTIATRRGQGETEGLTIQLSNKNNTMADEDEIQIEYGHIEIEWKQTFTTAVLEPVINMCDGMIYLGMSAETVGPKKKNMGLWLVSNVINGSNRPDVTSGFLFSVLRDKKK